MTARYADIDSLKGQIAELQRGIERQKDLTRTAREINLVLHHRVFILCDLFLKLGVGTESQRDGVRSVRATSLEKLTDAEYPGFGPDTDHSEPTP